MSLQQDYIFLEGLPFPMDADTRIFNDLLAGFRNGPVGQHKQLTVEVQDGVVTIAGRVYTLAERKAVERVAGRVVGIRTLILKIGAALKCNDPQHRVRGSSDGR